MGWGYNMRRWFLAGALIAGLPLSAIAHESCDGESAKELGGCCGIADSKNLDVSEVERRGDVWYVFLDGDWRAVIKYGNVPVELLPQDDKTHGSCYTVWYRRAQGQDQPQPGYVTDHFGHGQFVFYCLQGPVTF